MSHGISEKGKIRLKGLMRTLQKPKGSEDESRKSSTCQPGNISKYSDMLLVETPPSLASKLSPLLFTIAVVDAVGVEILVGLVDGFEFRRATETGFLMEDC